MASSSRAQFVLPAALLALGILLGALVFGLFFYSARADTSTIQVVGAANERFTSDVAKWRLNIARRVNNDELSAGYAQIRDDLDRVISHLQSAGIDSTAISIQPVNAHQVWGREGLQEGYNLVQSLYVISEDPDRLEAIAINPSSLLESGIVLEGSYLEYYYSQLADLKRALLSKATQDARQRAMEIAGGDGNRDLGRMVTGRAGVFQITEPYSTEVSGGGIYSTSTKEKEISVTVHATFETD